MRIASLGRRQVPGWWQIPTSEIRRKADKCYGDSHHPWCKLRRIL